MTIEVTHPSDALAFLRREFPLAQLELDRSRDLTLCGYFFVINKRSKLFCPLLTGGGVDLRAVRLFRDGQAYARNKRAAKRATKKAAAL
jgi:hypothetical protein